MIENFERITNGPENKLLDVDNGPIQKKQEIETIRKFNGCPFLIFNLFLFAFGGGSFALTVFLHWIFSFIGGLSLIISIICFFGYFVVDPNYNAVVMFCGKRKGIIKETGYFWINPFYSCKFVSIKSNTLNSNRIKINDKDGIPIFAKCSVVWKVVDPYKVLYEVQGFNSLVTTHSESALRYIGCQFPYDIKEDEICLKYQSREIDQALKEEFSKRVAFAGIEIQEAKITEVTISPEVSNIMLRIQAADVLVAAREKIVEGAIGTINDTVNSVKANNLCEMPREKKAKLVMNMLLVLSGESPVTPIIKI